MLEKIVAAVAMSLFAWLEKRMDRPNVSVDLALDRPRLIRAGSRLRAWVRSQDGVRQGRNASQDLKGEGKRSGPLGRPVDGDASDGAT